MVTLADVKVSTQELPPRVLLVGTQKIGKTTFASQWPKPIFAPIKGEEGIDAVEVAHFPTVDEYDKLMKMLGVLYSEEHDYQTLVIDSASALEPLIWQHLCKANNLNSIEDFGFGKGYVQALTIWREILNGLDAIRVERKMAVILIGHTKVKQFNDPLCDPYDQYQFDINERAANLIYRWCDSILFANKKAIPKKQEAGFKKTVTHAIGKDESMLYTRSRPAHPGGGRGIYGELTYELPLNYEAFQNAVNEAKENKQ